MTKYLKHIVIVVACAIAYHACAHDEMNELAKVKAKYKVYEWMSLNGEYEFWRGNDRPRKWNTLLNVQFKITDWFSIAPGYRYEREVKNKKWQHENRALVDLLFAYKLGDWRFDDRLRFELRDKSELQHPYMRYRNRIRVKTPWQWTEYKINPYASWELFLDDRPGSKTKDLWNRNRFEFGVTMKLSEHISCGVFYMFKVKKSDGEWRPSHIPGIEMSFSF